MSNENSDGAATAVPPLHHAYAIFAAFDAKDFEALLELHCEDAHQRHAS
jgi:hypothetical protein